MTLSIAATSAGSWRESDLAFGLQEGNTILITKAHWNINPAQKQSQAKAAPKSSSHPSAGKGGGGGGGKSGGSSRGNGGTSGSGGSGKADCDSFLPGAKVLMADGSNKAIEEVKVSLVNNATTYWNFKPGSQIRTRAGWSRPNTASFEATSNSPDMGSGTPGRVLSAGRSVVFGAR
ncbi:hypothetical protein PV341_36365 [Streptomyces sp. PA03-1a]|nr:hypothetical protein [Streptomyces sp. PA03-1a]MDX2817560.1 hypothetical protein [Streptomyces sp. PA03-5A]